MDLTTPHVLSAVRSGLSGRRQLLWPVLLTAAITWESVEAVPSVGPAWLSIDKLAHFGVFGLLATTIARLDQAEHWWLLGALWAIVLVSVYGFGDELLQGFTPNRSMEFADWAADTLGAAVAVIVYLRWTWYGRVLETPLRRQPACHCEEPRTAGATEPSVSDQRDPAVICHLIDDKQPGRR